MKKYLLLIFLFIPGFLLYFDCSKLAENPTTVLVDKCEVCHQVPPADSMHRPGANIAVCRQCHSGYSISGKTITMDSTHNNGTINYQCDLCHGYPKADTMWYHYGCSLAHLNCDSCHPGVAVKNNMIEALPASHNNDSGFVQISCTSCHGFPPGGLSHAKSSASHINCDSCHTGVVVKNLNISILPNHSTSPIKCIVCHGAPPRDGIHDTANKYNCDVCHAEITIVNNSYILDSATHNNGSATIKVKACNVCHGFPPPGNSHMNSSPMHVNCDSCHSRIVVIAGIPSLLPNHNDGPINCGVCHSVPPNTTPHNTAQKFNCDSCHTGVSTSNNLYSLDPSLHNNGTVGLKCTPCHAFPPTDNPHPEHVTVKKYDCSVCHSGYNGATIPPTPPAYHLGDTIVKFSNFLSIGAIGAKYDTATKSCSAVYCHGNFPDGTNRTVKMSDANTIGCAFCHDTVSMFANGHPRTDTLVWHRHTNAGTIKSCEYCHAGYSITAPVSVVDSTHINGVNNVTIIDNSGNRVSVKPDANGHVNLAVCTPCH